jgi:hypothetical protein
MIVWWWFRHGDRQEHIDVEALRCFSEAIDECMCDRPSLGEEDDRS